MMQLVIQRRVTSIIENKLSERRKHRNSDDSDRKQKQTSEGDGGAVGEESRDPEKGPGDSGACYDTQSQHFADIRQAESGTRRMD
jgi:hypothetical protein